MDKNSQPQFITWENDTRKYIGKRIAEMRKQAGISQVELAEKSGIGDSHIARIEMGRYSVGIDTLQKIADVFGKKIEFVDNPKLCIKSLVELGFADSGIIMENIRYFKKGDSAVLITESEEYNYVSSLIRSPQQIESYEHLIRLLTYELPKINTIFEHTSGVKGVFVKRYTPTGHVENIMIDCGGCEFHAPASEFKEIVSQNHCKNKSN